MSAKPHVVDFDQLRELSGAKAIAAGVIDQKSRFGLHGLKHRGITDTSPDQKKSGGGHKTEAMASHYDHELQVVDPAGRK